LAQAFALAGKHDVSLPAALSLALAAQQRAPLATLDARLANAARQEGLQLAVET
jgi:predicted nucleic acid-binding protein